MKENNIEQNNRNSNIELLRILCIISIIIHHSFFHSSIPFLEGNINCVIMYIIQVLGRISNNIFILITGYYMINKTIKKENILKLFLETIFYSYIILLAFSLLSPKSINIDLVIKSIFPIMSNSEGFITAYLLLYLSIPFLNKLLNCLDKKQIYTLDIFLILTFSLMPSINFLLEYYSDYIWFACLYSIGGTIKKYPPKELIQDNKYILIFTTITTVICLLFNYKIKNNLFCLTNINNFISFILSVSIFVFFVKKKEWTNQVINYIVSSSLGIYLLHDNFLVRQVMWKKLNIAYYIQTNYFWIYEISVVLFIFCLAFLIDKARKKFIERPLFNYINKRRNINIIVQK